MQRRNNISSHCDVIITRAKTQINTKRTHDKMGKGQSLSTHEEAETWFVIVTS